MGRACHPLRTSPGGLCLFAAGVEGYSRLMGADEGGTSRGSPSARWWARQDSNLQPDRYERPALTIELQAPPRAAERRPATVPAPFTGPVAIRQSRAQSTETPANSTTLRHFSVSSATSLPNSAGVIGLGRPPTSASRATSLGSFNAS